MVGMLVSVVGIVKVIDIGKGGWYVGFSDWYC